MKPPRQRRQVTWPAERRQPMNLRELLKACDGNRPRQLEHAINHLLRVVTRQLKSVNDIRRLTRMAEAM